MRVKFIVLGALALIAVAVGTFVVWKVAAPGRIWSELSRAVPARPLDAEEIKVLGEGVDGRRTPDGDQAGLILLANGDVWRFAFRSHHLVDAVDSYVVFSGPSGTYRVRGESFCCEVQFPGDKIPPDSESLIAFLREWNASVERVP